MMPSRLPIHGTQTTDFPLPLAVMPSGGNPSSACPGPASCPACFPAPVEGGQFRAGQGLLQIALEKPALVVGFHVRERVTVFVVIDAPRTHNWRRFRRGAEPAFQRLKHADSVFDHASCCSSGGSTGLVEGAARPRAGKLQCNFDCDQRTAAARACFRPWDPIRR